MTDPTAPAVSRPRVRRPWLLAATAVLLAVAAAAGTYALTGGTRDHGGMGDTAMADRAAQVMPFDLNATTHTFTKTATGGIEQVTADNPADQHNIDLIRQHLQHEVGRFAAGDFGDPATIHGTAMPGLGALRTGYAHLDIRFEQPDTGARIVYDSADPALVNALHTWFDAQTSDHTMPGMGTSG